MSLTAAISAFAQTTIYSENFGTPSAITPVTSFTGYQNASPITYTGTAELRNTTTSSGYTGASSDGCIFLASTSAEDKTLIISGINTQNYTGIALSFGQWKSTDASSNQMTVEVSDDGTNWTSLSYTRSSGSGTSVWTLINATGTIPATNNLRIRFKNTISSNAGFRIDDVKVTGTSTLSVSDISKKNTFNIYPTQVKDGIIHISSDKNSPKNIKIYDQSSKLIINTKIQNEVNVSTLSKGVYLIQVEENGKTETKKFVVN